MTRKEINDGNRRIAQFLGYEYIPFNNPTGITAGWWHKQTSPLLRCVPNPHKLLGGFYLGRSVKDLNFHCDWNQLMPTVMKILYEGHCAALHINASQITLSKEPFFENRRIHTKPDGTITDKPIELIWQLVVNYLNQIK